MSHSDTDSEGFESADDNNEFEENKKAHKEESKNTSSKKTDEKPSVGKNPKDKVISPVEKPDAKAKDKDGQKIEEVKKEISVSNEKKPKESEKIANDFDDNWEWGDDDNDEEEDEKNEENINNINASLPKKKSDFENKPSDLKEHSTSNTNTAPPREIQNPKETESYSAGSGQASKNQWTPWSGMASFLTTATDSVASFTSHVSSVIESNIGIPDPSEIAEQQRQQQTAEKTSDNASIDSNASEKKIAQEREENLLSLGSLMSNVTQISNRVITGGLDTLEGIGKKTMNILQENDPGLMNKRKLLGLDNTKPVLSQVKI